MKKIFIIGSDSFLAKKFIKKNKKKFIFGLSSRSKNFKFDIQKDSPEILPINQYDFFIIFIGISNTEYCEKNPDISLEVNYLKMKELISFLCLNSKKVIFLSTSLVINFTNNKKNGFYPYHKLLIENEIKNNKILRRNCIVIRPSKILTVGESITNKCIKHLKANQKIKAFDDYLIAPISLNFFINSLNYIILNCYNGFYNLCNSSCISYFEYALMLKRIIGNSSSILIPDSYKNNMYALLTHQNNPSMKLTKDNKKINLGYQSLNEFNIDLNDDVNNFL